MAGHPVKRLFVRGADEILFMSSAMTALRRHLFGVTWTILSVHALFVVLGAADVCRDREHTHGGVAAPDCPMHHRVDSDADQGHHHAHHIDASSSDGASSGSAQLSCHCPGDAPTIVLGQLAVLQLPVSHRPLLQAVVLAAFSEPNVADLLFSPPSPPPR
jgi:hypothetical protein